MKPLYILRAGYLGSYIYALRNSGVDPAPMLSRYCLPTEINWLSEYMLAAKDVHAFVQEASATAAAGVISAAAGLHHARRQPNPFRDGANYAVNLLDAIQRHNDRVTQYSPGVRFAVQVDQRLVRWSKTTGSPLAETEIFCVANLVGHIRTFTHSDWSPTSVEVGVASPEVLTCLPFLSGTPVRKSVDHGTHLHFSASQVWQSPFNRNTATGADQRRLGTIEEPDFVESMRQLMKGYARSGSLSIERAANAGRMSVRTLQRQLRNSGVSYAELADQVKFEVARDLLITATNLTVTKISMELGYRDPGSFSRAFRRCTGLSPSEFRRIQAPDRTLSIA
jgi:AraC-like DNA-binding protein